MDVWMDIQTMPMEDLGLLLPHKANVHKSLGGKNHLSQFQRVKRSTSNKMSPLIGAELYRLLFDDIKTASQENILNSTLISGRLLFKFS